MTNKYKLSELMSLIDSQIEMQNKVNKALIATVYSLYGDGIESLELSVRSYNALKRAGIDTIESLTWLSKLDLQCIKNLGEISINEILEKLKEAGYELRE